MCGIFGVIDSGGVVFRDVARLVDHAEQRGKDSSGLIFDFGGAYTIHRADFRAQKLVRRTKFKQASVVLGHSRLITNGQADNQPVLYDGVAVLHNGIVVNHESLWPNLSKTRRQVVDTEVIAAMVAECLEQETPIEIIADHVLARCEGVVACAVLIPRVGKLLLFSNNGSLYLGERDGTRAFSSERFPLVELGCDRIQQVRDGIILDVVSSEDTFREVNHMGSQRNLIPTLLASSDEEKLLHYRSHSLRRCTRCILPETMPFIEFDHDGVCSYCLNYKIRNNPKPLDDLKSLVNPYRNGLDSDCIVPLSGGRDSCFALHLAVKELGLKPITFTYDWGMVTDLGRRNVSRISAALGVENIIIADDIEKKRNFISSNLKAWLKSPHLGMISVLTAGDKHFFRHLKTVQAQTGVSLNLWGINPLEVTHFKAGFLGVPPDFKETRVYSHGAMKQIRYQSLRFRAMLNSPGYFNRSLWDTLSGEYHRSFSPKKDYFHLFDYWKWSEEEINETLDAYDWERAPDTRTTWRIGDGTAAFYNYVYYSVAGFTEHDTFRSNQIREGDISRSEALDLVSEENAPRFQNIKWYLDVLGFDFSRTINTVNSIPKMYQV
jgi:hypothetical protein